MWAKGLKLPTQVADGRSQCFCGAAIGLYNNARLHQSLGNRTPMAVWRAGVTGEWGESAVEYAATLGQR